MSCASSWPSSEAADHVAVTLASPGRCLTFASNGAAPPREVSPDAPPPQIIQQYRGAARLLDALKVVIRLLVKAVYLFPILLVVKLILFLTGHWVGDLITVAFVVLVVVFFFFFALFFMLYAVAGPRSRRPLHPRLRLPDAGDLDDLASAAGYGELEMTPSHALAERCEPDLTQQEPVRVRGRIAGTVEQGAGDVVLRDCWLEQGEVVGRLVAGSSFAVVREGYTPVVIWLEEAVHLVVANQFHASGVGELDLTHLAQYEQWTQDRSAGELSVPDLAGAQSCTLTVGDEVEVVGGEMSAVPDMADLQVNGRRLRLGKDGESSKAPYRGDGLTQGLLLRSREEAPLLISKL